MEYSTSRVSLTFTSQITSPASSYFKTCSPPCQFTILSANGLGVECSPFEYTIWYVQAETSISAP